MWSFSRSVYGHRDLKSKFNPNTVKHEPEKTPYQKIFHAVAINPSVLNPGC